MEKIVIIHFQPLEKYPPIINLLDYLTSIKYAKNVTVFTTENLKNNNSYVYSNPNVNIIRLKSPSKTKNYKKLLQYFHLYASIFCKLLQLKPTSILYYETLSVLPAYWYKRINTGCKIFIHYHEYTSPSEYSVNSIVVKQLHKIEKKIYKYCYWISHTNSKRLFLFLYDEQINIDSNKHHIMPNYPSINWAKNEHSLEQIRDVKNMSFVYFGALGLHTMYIKEFAHFVIKQAGKVNWHIYTNQFEAETIDYINNLQSDYIKICGEANYYDIPRIIKENKYTVGLILYKGYTPNHVHSAPNKLFEYLSCGIHVWYPSVLEGCKEYSRNTSFPLVLEVDFNTSLDEALEKHKTLLKSTDKITEEHFYCEEVYKKLVSVL